LSSDEQLAWLEQLSADDLKNWLRRSIWVQTAVPLIIPRTATLIAYLSDLLKTGSSGLLSQLRIVLPGLLQEWGGSDTSRCLDELLILCGTLRCASAESTVAMIATERLKDRPDEIGLRQRSLSVLSGFGCTDSTEHLFRRYLVDVNYAALCYRALYRHDLTFAASEFTTVVKVHSAARVTQNLRAVLDILFFDYANKRERIEIWKSVFKITKPPVLEEVLKILQVIGIVVAVPFEPAFSPEVEIIYRYSSEELDSVGDKIETQDVSNEALVAISRALEAFLRSGNQVERSVAAAAR
jgi:hypothetical protein